MNKQLLIGFMILILIFSYAEEKKQNEICGYYLAENLKIKIEHIGNKKYSGFVYMGDKKYILEGKEIDKRLKGTFKGHGVEIKFSAIIEGKELLLIINGQTIPVRRFVFPNIIGKWKGEDYEISITKKDSYFEEEDDVTCYLGTMKKGNESEQVEFFALQNKIEGEFQGSDFVITLKKDTLVLQYKSQNVVLKKFKKVEKRKESLEDYIKRILIQESIVDIENTFPKKVKRDNRKAKEILYNSYKNEALKKIKRLKYVTKLDLSDLNMKDEDLKAISSMTTIKHLDLSKSKITDIGLKHIQNFKNLRSLSLKSNRKITMKCFDVIKKFRLLSSLDFSFCWELFSGNIETIKLQPLKALETLYLSNTIVNDEALKTIIVFKNLKRLNISLNRVTEKGIKDLKKLEKLEYLSLHSCGEINDIILKHVSDMRSLKKLELSCNDTITSKGIKYLKDLKNLNILDISSCKNLGDKALRQIGKFSALKKLKMSFLENVTDNGLSYLNNLQRLNHIELSCCEKITSTGIMFLSELKNLKYMDLTLCKELYDSVFQHLGMLKELEYLKLKHCNKITGKGLKYIRDLNNLKELNLTGCKRITDQGIMHLITLKKLKVLHLAECEKITDDGLKYIGKITSLEKLNISDLTEISTKGSMYLKNLTLLKYLNMNNCGKVWEPGAFLENLSLLEEFHARNIYISINELKYLKGKKYLKVLDLSYCKVLKNEDLAFLQDLKFLEVLKLNNCNKINDDGLSLIKDMVSLRRLELQNLKELSCNSTRHLVNLSKLRYLDISGCKCINDKGIKYLQKLNLKYLIFNRNPVTIFVLIELFKIKTLKRLEINNTSYEQFDGKFKKIER